MADDVQYPIPVPIRSLPGIKRDGTTLEGDNYVDGQWCRWQRGLPRKIGGYQQISRYLRDIVNTIHAYTKNNLTYVHMGSPNHIERLYVDSNGGTSTITDRTPTTLTENDYNLWQFDVNTLSDTGVTNIIAQVAPNLNDISNNSGGELYYGPLTGTGLLTPVTDLPATYSATGGVVSLGPYTVVFGNDGFIMNSAPGSLSFIDTGSNNSYVTGQKIIRGLPLRGGPGNSPSGLFWSLDSLVRGTWVGGTDVFQYDTITSQTSILSAASVIEYDGIYYWPGTDRWHMFNGVVREIENNLNLNWFFDGLNRAQRQKVFAFKVPRYGEIWWCYPRGTDTECNDAVVFNVRENIWYDTSFPNGGRSSGLFPSVLSKPLMTGITPVLNGEEVRITEGGDTRSTESGDTRVTEESEAARYKLWVHEQGTDEVDGQDLQPIESFFETADISFPVQSQINAQTQILYIEPDFVQSGNMTVQVRGRANARSEEVNGEVMTFSDDPLVQADTVVYLKTQRRELRFRFGSNEVGGDFQAGLTLGHIQPGDGTMV